MSDLSTNEQTVLMRFFTERPIRRAYLPGSFVPLRAGKKTDVDILVELDPDSNIGTAFFAYGLELEKLLRKKVGFVNLSRLSPRLQDLVGQGKILIYEKSGPGSRGHHES